MKHILLVCSFLIITSSLLAQHSFTLVYGGEESKRPNCIKKIDDCYYLLSSDFILPSYLGNTGEIIKIDSTGKILKKVELFTEGQVSGLLRKIHTLSDTEFLVFGMHRQDENSNTSIWVIKMDTSLNLIWDKKIQTELPQLSRMSYEINKEDNIAFVLTLSTLAPNYLKSILFLELTQNGDLVKSRYETTGNPITTNGYSIISHSNGYYAFVDGFSSYLPFPPMGFAERLDLDTNFNIIRVLPLPGLMNGYMTAEKINEHSYLLAGEVYYTGFYTEIAVQKTDTSNSVLYSNHSGLPGDLFDQPAWLECLSSIDENIIYTGGNGNSSGGFHTCNLLHPKTFILSNYDSLLNNRWTKYYGSDTACYYMMDLDATDDGGCIMAGTILSPNSNPNKTDVIIIKVDSDGLITSTNKPGIRAMEAMVYPNPGNEYLMLQTGQQNTGSTFKLVSISGQKLIEQTVNSTTQQIHTSKLPPGTYGWTLSKGSTVIETGKWIKN
ncbi:MAG: T9SS type A sorting domain-containing protein [Lentimicrobium sp.]|jgi:hypothetical protein|nr:T9SS type A sorting domain-containing protein [Lentimicrobium sp.]